MLANSAANSLSSQRSNSNNWAPHGMSQYTISDLAELFSISGNRRPHADAICTTMNFMWTAPMLVPTRVCGFQRNYEGLPTSAHPVINANGTVRTFTQ
jgi:hypothetical protein